MRDLMNNVAPKRCIEPQSSSADTPIVGQVIDGQGFGSVTYLIALGSIGDANVTFSVLLEESDASGSGFGAVADADLLGLESQAGFQFDDDNECRKLGYVGAKRYTRLTITPSGNSGTPSAAFLAAIALLGHPELAPTDNPPT